MKASEALDAASFRIAVNGPVCTAAASSRIRPEMLIGQNSAVLPYAWLSQSYRQAETHKSDHEVLLRRVIDCEAVGMLAS